MIKFCRTTIIFLALTSFQPSYSNDLYKCSIQQLKKPLYCVSMLQLLASPNEFNNKRVLITGFLNIEFESSALYFHKEDSDKLLYSNSIWISASKPNFNKVYVILEGTFLAGNRGHLGIFSGELINVSRINKILTRADIKKMREKMLKLRK